MPDLTASCLPDDAAHATLVGRVWRPDVAGPSVVAVRNGNLIDVTHRFPTVRDLCETSNPAASLAAADGEPIATLKLFSPTPRPRPETPESPGC